MNYASDNFFFFQNTAILDEDLTDTSGALAELNTILTSTQTKLNRFKVSSH